MHLPLRTRLALEIDRQLSKTHKKHHPLHQLFWECTLRCNVHCLHCGSDCRVDAAQPDMPAEDFLRAIDTLTPHLNPNEVMIIVSGGEPLVRKDIEDVGRELVRRGYAWGIVTNGLLLSRERLDSLLRAGMGSLAISLDGFEAEHNWLRGHPLSFERTMAAIRLLAEQKDFTWDVITCANQRNFSYLPEFRDMLIENGVKEWRIFTIFPVGRAAQHPDLQLPDRDFRALMQFIEQTRKEGRIKLEYACEGFLGEWEGRVRDYLYSCQAGISVASILADGGISACMSIRYDYRQGNIYEDNLWDVWENRFQSFRNREWARQGECEDCKLFRYCEGNGMHLHDDEGRLLFCHVKRLE